MVTTPDDADIAALNVVSSFYISTGAIGSIPCLWSWIEGRKDQNREVKSGNKFQVALAMILLGLELDLINLSVVFRKAPSGSQFIYFATMIPLISLALFGFVYTERKNTLLREQASRLSLIVLKQQNEEKIQSVLNPLEQSQFLIESSDLKLVKKIGQGGSGWIYQATLGEHTIVAAKEIISSNRADDIEEFQHEARMLTQMNHPHVLRVLGFCTKRARESLDMQEHKYIVTEFAPNGSLEDAIDGAVKIAKIIQETKSGTIQMPFSKIQALEWALQIASGMAFLHGRGFVHRDIKPQNVLLNKSNDALVADLGTVRRSATEKAAHPQENRNKEEQAAQLEALCVQLGQVREDKDMAKETIYIDQMTQMTGTPMFMAPEQYNIKYSFPVDVWAFGMTLVRLFTLKWPYGKEVEVRKIILGVAKGTLHPIKVRLNDVPHPDVLMVIRECLMRDPKRRPSFKDVNRWLSVALKECRRKEKEKTLKRRNTLEEVVFA